MPDRGRSARSLARRGLELSSLVLAALSCGETAVQIDPTDVVELLVSTDTARIGFGRSFDLAAGAPELARIRAWIRNGAPNN